MKNGEAKARIDRLHQQAASRCSCIPFVPVRGFLFFLVSLLQNSAAGRLPGVATKGARTQVVTFIVRRGKTVNLA